MPVFLETTTAPGIHAALWKITESSGDLFPITRLTPDEEALYLTFRNELRKRQWLACRALLQSLELPGDPLLTYNMHGKPALTTPGNYISLSHSGEMAAVAWSSNIPVGIDIEKISPRMERVSERFLQPAESDSLAAAHRLAHLSVFWCGKEALYKIFGDPSVDFRHDIHIQPFDYLCDAKQHPARAMVTINGSPRHCTICYQQQGDYMMVVAFEE